MNIYKAIQIPIGQLVIIINNSSLIGLYWLNQLLSTDEFEDETGFVDLLDLNFLNSLEGVLNKKYMLNCLASNDHPLIFRTENQLKQYFQGQRQSFDIPIELIGTEFQKLAWNELINIPFGETRSYVDQSKKVGRPKAFRAVGTANSKNPISIIIPCHRVIRKNGLTSGYAGGVNIKTSLLELESRLINL